MAKGRGNGLGDNQGRQMAQGGAHKGMCEKMSQDCVTKCDIQHRGTPAPPSVRLSVRPRLSPGKLVPPQESPSHACRLFSASRFICPLFIPTTTPV